MFHVEHFDGSAMFVVAEGISTSPARKACAMTSHRTGSENWSHRPHLLQRAQD